MSVTILLELHSKPENLEQLKSIFQEILPDTRAYDGCQGLELIVNQDDPNHFIVIEKWNSRQHYETYFAWRVETGVVDKLAALSSQPPSIRYYDQIGVY